VENKLKIFNAAARTILLYGAQVWGYMEYDEVERLLRYFIKRILILPKNTPNYMLFLETGIRPMYLTTLQFHFDYIRKAVSMPPSRLPNILVKETYAQKTFWAIRWFSLYNSANITVPLNLFSARLSEDHENIIQHNFLNHSLQCIAQARSSQNHDLYGQLDYDIVPYCFGQLPLYFISLFFKARGGLLHLNTHPFASVNTRICTICNLNIAEDIFHVVGVCPIYNNMRLFYLGSNQLSLSETKSLLNSPDPKPLCEFLLLALKYRNLILNEFS